MKLYRNIVNSIYKIHYILRGEYVYNLSATAFCKQKEMIGILNGGKFD